MKEHLEIEVRDNLGLVWFNQPNEKVNVLNESILLRFPSLLDELEKDARIQAIVFISAKPSGFIAGADIEMLQATHSQADGQQLSIRGQNLLDTIEAFPKPIIAAIHGPCLGGGLEVALACRGRVAAKDAQTFFGLPEVKLGLLPGSGGTQRLPQLIGLQASLDMMLSGKNIYPKQALRLGLVHHLTSRETLIPAAQMLATKMLKGSTTKTAKRPLLTKLLDSNALGRHLVFSKAKKMVIQKTKGHYPAPLEILKAIKAGYKGREQGYKQEASGFGSLLMSSQGKALIRLFRAMNASKKMPSELTPKPISRLAILGAGLMGSGIAEVSASETLEVVLKDLNLEALGKAKKGIQATQTKKVKRRIIRPFDADRFNSFIHYTTHTSELSKADIVVEAVFEDLALKHRVLKEIEAITQENCVFASNTSAIPIKDIAKASKRPQQVIGMHYFSPVQKMPLLEIIVTDQTEPWVLATAIQLGIQQKKHIIVVQDGPGFYTTRILAPMLNEAMTLVEEGVPLEDIEQALTQFGFPVGPLALLDEVGIDVGAHVSDSLSPMFEARGGKTAQGFKRLKEAGYLGRKNNMGFYTYPKKGRKQLNPDILKYFNNPSPKKVDQKTLQHRMVMAMVNEAAICLEEGIIKSPQDGDLGAILGLGFPPFLGGPFYWSEHLKNRF